MNKNVEVLISAMNQADCSIFNNSNIQTDALMINQCDINTSSEIVNGNNTFRVISTTDRGLSRSRNLAISNAKGKYCLVCDDDEYFFDGLSLKIETAYANLPQADVIIFQVLKKNNIKCGFGERTRRLKKLDCLKVASWQISFKLSSIKGKVSFDTNLGAGTPNGAGEENKFLLDCYKAGLKIYYVPVEIATVAQEQSTWFKGFDERFFFNRGKTTNYTLGKCLSILYAFYFLIFKLSLYKNDISPLRATKFLFKGIFAKNIDVSYE